MSEEMRPWIFKHIDLCGRCSQRGVKGRRTNRGRNGDESRPVLTEQPTSLREDCALEHYSTKKTRLLAGVSEKHGKGD